MKPLFLAVLMLLFISCEDQVVTIDGQFLNYLTYHTEETSREMTINIVGSSDFEELELEVNDGEKNQVFKLKGKKAYELEGIHIFRKTLKDLRPNHIYTYKLLLNGLIGSQYKFRTLPEDSNNFRIIVGGDTGTDEKFESLVKLSATYSPHIAVIGGDIAYANGDPKNWKMWQKWLTIWRDNAITKEGFQIPLITAIGNHETRSEVLFNKKKRAPFFFSLFPQNGDKTYFMRKVGKDNLFVILDTGHVHGFVKQALWMKKNKKKIKSFKRKFAFYHIPFYPGHRSMSTGGSIQGRTFWRPIFEKYKFTIGFEHHDHVLKRTHPIKKGKIDSEGIVYLGDGAMGRSTREVAQKWYLNNVQSENHFWLVDIGKDKVDYRAIGMNNEVLDKFETP